MHVITVLERYPRNNPYQGSPDFHGFHTDRTPQCCPSILGLYQSIIVCKSAYQWYVCPPLFCVGNQSTVARDVLIDVEAYFDMRKRNSINQIKSLNRDHTGSAFGQYTSDNGHTISQIDRVNTYTWFKSYIDLYIGSHHNLYLANGSSLKKWIVIYEYGPNAD